MGLASQASKVAAYQELNKLVQALARKKTWEVLNKNVMTEVVRAVYVPFGARLTQEKLGQAVPVAGVILGAGLNAKTLSSAADAAEHIYRERFLREKYGLPAEPMQAIEPHEDVIDIAEILEAKIDAEDVGNGSSDM